MKIVSREEVESLVKMADRLDSEGRQAEAAALDATIQRLVLAAEELEDEKEKGPRQLSNKAKGKIRAVHRAAQSLMDADLDIRGQHKKHLREIEDMCEKICDLASQLDLD